jgi:PAS domain S-box-containing protein
MGQRPEVEMDEPAQRPEVDERATDQLRALEQNWLFASIIEFLPDATFVIDRQKRVVAWNRACETMTGVSKAQVLGKGDFAYAEAFYDDRRPILIDLLDLPPSELQAAYKHVQRKGDGLCAEVFISRLRGGQGAHLWGEAAPLFDEAGQRCGAIEVVRDITQQKRAEEAARLAATHVQYLSRYANDFIILLDEHFRFLEVNEQVAAGYGYSREELVGMHAAQLRAEETQAEFVGQTQRAQVAGKEIYETTHRRKDGSKFPVEINLRAIDVDGKRFYQAVIRDISKRKKMEAALRASEREYRELVMLANSIILRWTRDGRITFINEFGERFFGYTAAELIGQHVVGTIVPGSESTGRDLRPLMDDICADPKAFVRSINENVRRNGERVWIDWANRVVLDEQGQIREILSIGSDITERKRAEAEVQKLNQELQRYAEDLERRVAARTEQLGAKNQELREFAYTVSHDLKAPLRGIAGYANELNRKHREGLGARAQFCLTQILAAATNLDRLIEDLLRYSRLDAESPHPGPVDLRGLVDMILRDRDLIIKEQHIEVTVDIAFAGLSTWERGLVQVLSNLIDNAIKYSRHAGPPRVHIAAAEVPSGWQICVRDNGVGFDMKYHDRIFKLFNRLVRAEEFEGTGAGLAIARKVLDKQGGRIWAESAPGQGATFFVELPKPSQVEGTGEAEHGK